MCDLPLGAFKRGTNEYISPSMAKKGEEYVCPDCEGTLNLRQGTIRIHHFAHSRSDNPCTYYSRPSESQIHKDAKLLLKSLLDSKRGISFHRKCACVNSPYCCNGSTYEIPPVDTGSSIIIEHRFEYNGLKVADVAYIDNNEILCIFEIYNTHKTQGISRPEPWFEIDATKLITMANTDSEKIIIECIRTELCDSCNFTCPRCKKVVGNCLRGKFRKTWCRNNCDMITFQNIYLDVPFSQKDLIKGYGGQFDGELKKWFINTDNPNKNDVVKRWNVVEY
jgi:uncharacterized protein YkuJ